MLELVVVGACMRSSLKFYVPNSDIGICLKLTFSVARVSLCVKFHKNLDRAIAHAIRFYPHPRVNAPFFSISLWGNRKQYSPQTSFVEQPPDKDGSEEGDRAFNSMHLILA